jgi:hypothetical protein
MICQFIVQGNIQIMQTSPSYDRRLDDPAQKVRSPGRFCLRCHVRRVGCIHPGWEQTVTQLQPHWCDLGQVYILISHTQAHSII